MKLEQFKGYVTLNEGMDFRSISKELEKLNIFYKHATVRNIADKANKDFLNNFIEIVGFDESKIDKETVLNTVQFYDNLMEIMSKVIESHPEIIENTIKQLKEETNINEG
jgi:hypothetical protein